ncbi:MAG: hypothetical protein GY938_12070 [Ketobacter sp.]|nr:hypothetical protein [Ketobacter sp.]
MDNLQPFWHPGRGGGSEKKILASEASKNFFFKSELSEIPKISNVLKSSKMVLTEFFSVLIFFVFLLFDFVL